MIAAATEASISQVPTNLTSLADSKLAKYFEAAVKFQSSDLIMRAGHVPKLRLKGALKNLDVPPIPAKEFERAIESSMSESQWKWYAEHGSLDIGVDFDIKGQIHRFRINIFRTRGRSGIAAGVSAPRSSISKTCTCPR